MINNETNFNEMIQNSGKQRLEIGTSTTVEF